MSKEINNKKANVTSKNSRESSLVSNTSTSFDKTLISALFRLDLEAIDLKAKSVVSQLSSRKSGIFGYKAFGSKFVTEGNFVSTLNVLPTVDTSFYTQNIQVDFISSLQIASSIPKYLYIFDKTYNRNILLNSRYETSSSKTRNLNHFVDLTSVYELDVDVIPNKQNKQVILTSAYQLVLDTQPITVNDTINLSSVYSFDSFFLPLQYNKLVNLTPQYDAFISFTSKSLSYSLNLNSIYLAEVSVNVIRQERNVQLSSVYDYKELVDFNSYNSNVQLSSTYENSSVLIESAANTVNLTSQYEIEFTINIQETTKSRSVTLSSIYETTTVSIFKQLNRSIQLTPVYDKILGPTPLNLSFRSTLNLNKTLGQTQYALRPTSDDTVSNWIFSPLYSKLDTNQNTYIQSPTSGIDSCRVEFPDDVLFRNYSNGKLKIIYGKSSSDSNSLNFRIRGYQGQSALFQETLNDIPTGINEINIPVVAQELLRFQAEFTRLSSTSSNRIRIYTAILIIDT